MSKNRRGSQGGRIIKPPQGVGIPGPDPFSMIVQNQGIISSNQVSMSCSIKVILEILKKLCSDQCVDLPEVATMTPLEIKKLLDEEALAERKKPEDRSEDDPEKKVIL